MARFLSLFALSTLSLSILACVGDEPESTQRIRQQSDTAWRNAVNEQATPVSPPTPAWYEAVSGDELYRVAKSRETNYTTENDLYGTQYVEIMLAYGHLAFGVGDKPPELPAADVDFNRLWRDAYINHLDYLDEVVDMLGEQPEFAQPYGEQYAIGVTEHWEIVNAFTIEKPYGGLSQGKGDDLIFCPKNNPNSKRPYVSRSDINLDGERVRKVLPVTHPMRKLWTQRLAEINSVYECQDEGVPHRDTNLSYDMYTELGDIGHAKAMAKIIAHNMLEDFQFGYDVADDDRPSWESRTVIGDKEMFEEAVGWYKKAGFETNVAICVELAVKQTGSSLEKDQQYAAALIAYEYCGDTVNMTRMQALIPK
ncbi:MAG: hypothetical protein NUV56_00980 [Candidatus Uhrbacteria bacterium]|nr:hypothetical protein [Candidatus Uhrbacteria bacterium]